MKYSWVVKDSTDYQFILSAYAEDRGCKAADECERMVFCFGEMSPGTSSSAWDGPRQSSKSEGGFQGTTGVNPWGSILLMRILLMRIGTAAPEVKVGQIVVLRQGFQFLVRLVAKASCESYPGWGAPYFNSLSPAKTGC